MWSSMPDRPRDLGDFLQALIAFLAPGAAIMGVALLVSSPGGETITASEWVTAAVGCVVTSAAVEAQVARKAHALSKHDPPEFPPEDVPSRQA